MKRLKLLTSVAALALVLSLGACSKEEDEMPDDIDDVVDTDTELASEDLDTGNESSDTSESTPSEPDESNNSSDDDEDDDEDEDEDEDDDENLEDEEAKKFAEDLAAFQEVVEGLGANPFSDWQAYKFENDCEETRLIKADENGYPYGYYRTDVDVVSYFVDGTEYYNKWNSAYNTFDIGVTYLEQLGEDTAFIGLEQILELTVADVLSLSHEDDTYTISYQFEENNGVLLGSTTYTYKTSLTITSNELVKATREYSEVHTAGSIGGNDPDIDSKEAVEKVDPEEITLDLLVADGFDAQLWVKLPDPVLLGTFDWTGQTGTSTDNNPVAFTISTMQESLETYWTPESGFEPLSFTVTKANHMRNGMNTNASYYWSFSGNSECITFGNDNSDGELTIEFDSSIEVTSIDFVLCVNGGTQRTFSVNDESQTPIKYNQVDGYQSMTDWDPVPITTFESFTPSNVLEMVGLSSSNGDRVAVHSMAIYGRYAEEAED